LEIKKYLVNTVPESPTNNSQESKMKKHR
jgi:hypothetical protein